MALALDMDDLTLRPSYFWFTIYIASGVALVGFGILSVLSDLLAFGSILIIAGSLVAWTNARLCFNGASFVIMSNGLLYSSFGFGLIEWSDIDSVRLDFHKGGAVLCLKINDSGKYIARMPWHKRWYNRIEHKVFPSEWLINLRGFRGAKPHEVLAQVQQRISDTESAT